jgi:hypothetical protein
LPTNTRVGQWIIPSDGRGVRYDGFLLTDESLGPSVIHHFEYGSFQRLVDAITAFERVAIVRNAIEGNVEQMHRRG